MNKICWLSLSIICLLLSFMLSTNMARVWARTQQQSASTPAQTQAVQAAISLLLAEEDEYHLYLPFIKLR